MANPRTDCPCTPHDKGKGDIFATVICPACRSARKVVVSSIKFKVEQDGSSISQCGECEKFTFFYDVDSICKNCKWLVPDINDRLLERFARNSGPFKRSEDECVGCGHASAAQPVSFGFECPRCGTTCTIAQKYVNATSGAIALCSNSRCHFRIRIPATIWCQHCRRNLRHTKIAALILEANRERPREEQSSGVHPMNIASRRQGNSLNEMALPGDSIGLPGETGNKDEEELVADEPLPSLLKTNRLRFAAMIKALTRKIWRRPHQFLHKSKQETTTGQSTTPLTASPLHPPERHVETNAGQFTTPSRARDPEDVEGSTSSAFQSLVKRSIAAWDSLHHVDVEGATIDLHTSLLRSHSSLESVMDGNVSFWFFQHRDSFMNQPVLMKWDPHRLDEYILIPVAEGFVNKRDCIFVSHYWRAPDHPDPEAADLSLLRQDLDTLEWSYIWVDWTCMPQVPRSGVQQTFFKKGLARIPMLLRDCEFMWRFPTFEPRAWILYEVAAWVLDHRSFFWSHDNRPFIHHLHEMFTSGVRPVFDKYGYKCTNESDLKLVTGWLEIHVLLRKIFEDDVRSRREILDQINKPSVGKCTYWSERGLKFTVDKVEGIISYLDCIARFTPLVCRTDSWYETTVIGGSESRRAVNPQEFSRQHHGRFLAVPTHVSSTPAVHGSYSIDLNGADFRVVQTVTEFVGAFASWDRVALLLRTEKYKTDIHDNIMRQIDSKYAPSLPEQAFQHACFTCAGCFRGFPSSDLNSRASNSCTSTHAIAGTWGFTRFSNENGACVECGNQESFLILEVRQSYLDAVRRCWRHRAKHWWVRRGGGSAMCDCCSGDIDENGETYLVSNSRLECRRCADSLLSDGGGKRPEELIMVSTKRFNPFF